MKILGIKYTHDASIALIEDGVLRFSIELEKTGQGLPRHPKMLDLRWIDEQLEREGLSASDIDQFVVDGWKHDRQRFVKSAGYNEFDDNKPVLYRSEFPAAQLTGRHRAEYSGFAHVAGHLLGSYAMSPFSHDQQDVVLITWDGGHSARAYLFRPKHEGMTFLGVLVDICASVYANMGLYFGPFRDLAVIGAPEVPHRKFGRVEWPGKLMAYLAQGDAVAVNLVDKAFKALPAGQMGVSDDSVREHMFLRSLTHSSVNDANMLASIHEYLGAVFVDRATQLCPEGLPVVLSGGAALNIKWNAALRACSHFGEVWVPPVPNDSGSAIGQAVCEWYWRTDSPHIAWSVYSGPKLEQGASFMHWVPRNMDMSYLMGRLIARPEKPFVLLQGRAEIGPRALGHRSIIASAELLSNVALLNKIKCREPFRPIAPVCLHEYVGEVFSPGFADRYMVFEQCVRDAWRDRVPAIVHLDGSARVQTVDRRGDAFLLGLLECYRACSGIPLLCNTSANRLEQGFFHSIADACDWADKSGIDCVVADGVIYEARRS